MAARTSRLILQKRRPLPLRVATASDAAQIPGHTPLRDSEAELLQFGMDFGSAPVGILFGHTGDQLLQFLGNSGATAACPGAPAPVETKAGAVPCDNSLRFDNQEDIGPARPKTAERGPEQPVTGDQGWPRSLAFEDGNLLAESQDFQGSIGSGPEESAHGGQEGEKELEHELTVVTWRNAMWISALDVRATH
jgi:hypothetical protein